ncbi:MAG: hypothetical protein ACE147_04100 [Candidatus Methylomirabilales bacterium]
MSGAPSAGGSASAGAGRAGGSTTGAGASATTGAAATAAGGTRAGAASASRGTATGAAAGDGAGRGGGAAGSESGGSAGDLAGMGAGDRGSRESGAGYAGRVDDISDYMLAHAWRPGGNPGGEPPYGWGASDLSVLFWHGVTTATYVPVGLPRQPLRWIAYEDLHDVLLGAPQTGMRAEFSEAHRVLEHYAYGSYPRPPATSGLEGDRAPGTGLRSQGPAAAVTVGAMQAPAAAGRLRP